MTYLGQYRQHIHNLHFTSFKDSRTRKKYFDIRICDNFMLQTTTVCARENRNTVDED